MYDNTIVRACLDIVALFLLPRIMFSADEVTALQEWTCFRQFSINQLVQLLQERTLALRGQDAREHLVRLAKKTCQPEQLEAIEAALKMLTYKQKLPLESEAMKMLCMMENVFELPEQAILRFVERYFC
jgi:hypothetical protein